MKSTLFLAALAALSYGYINASETEVWLNHKMKDNTRVSPQETVARTKTKILTMVAKQDRFFDQYFFAYNLLQNSRTRHDSLITRGVHTVTERFLYKKVKKAAKSALPAHRRARTIVGHLEPQKQSADTKKRPAKARL